MAYFKLQQFTGIAPGVSPRLLNEQFGQTSQNINFESGSLVPLKEDSDFSSLVDTNRQSIYYYKKTDGSYVFLQWTQDNINVVDGPVPNDTANRLYWSGETYPKVGSEYIITNGGAPFPAGGYRLGVPAPSTPPTMAKSGTASSETPEPRAYVYTLVTGLGEEGPPSGLATASDGSTTLGRKGSPAWNKFAPA